MIDPFAGQYQYAVAATVRGRFGKKKKSNKKNYAVATYPNHVNYHVDPNIDLIDPLEKKVSNFHRVY